MDVTGLKRAEAALHQARAEPAHARETLAAHGATFHFALPGMQ